jgi:hypothetical protein
MSTPNLLHTFHAKYEEFAADLVQTFPELTAEVEGALAIDKGDRPTVYTAKVLTFRKGIPTHSLDTTPGLVLPGVTITQDLWTSVSEKTQKAIHEYVSILNLCVAFHEGMAGSFSKEWMDKMMKDAQESMSSLDFDSISKTFFKAFGSKDGATGGMPPLPERFLKGKLAKLAEDMVREFKPEDFGLSAEEMAKCESDPQKAFEILMKASMLNPSTIQKAMMRVAKKLQEKVQRGELKPQELAAEAEELMKEFESHPAFVDLMETFRSAFGTDNMQQARAQGREPEARLSLIQQRLRKKAEEKGLKKAQTTNASMQNTLAVDNTSDDFPSIAVPSKKGSKKH